MAREDMTSGLLSMVGTPIGNLGDASPRMVETLRHANVVLAEDTRVTAQLFARFDIHSPLQRADTHVLTSRIGPTLKRISCGEHVAFVCDAGMPGISDPGQRLVDAALDAGLPVEVIPGPSALTCALVASGLPIDHFFFEGFLPRKMGSMTARLGELATIPGAIVIYESPQRVTATLTRIAEVLPERQVALLRELTKLHEECVRGPSSEVAATIAARTTVKGECVIVIAAPSQPMSSTKENDEAITQAIYEGLAADEPKSALAKRLSQQFSYSRADMYDRILQIVHSDIS